MGQTLSKIVGGAVGFGAGGAAIVGGVWLIINTGGLGAVAGEVLISTGISSISNTIGQLCEDKSFSCGDWGKDVAISAVSGLVAAPFSFAGGVLVKSIAAPTAKGAGVAIAKGAITVASQTIGGGMSGGVNNVLTRAAGGKDVSGGDFLKGAAAGAAAGAVGSFVGQCVQGVGGAVGENFGKQISKSSQTMMKVGVGVAKGATGGATGAVAGKITENAFYRRKLTEKECMDTMKVYKVDFEDIKELWTFLNDNEIIVNEEIQKEVPPSLAFPENLQKHEELVRQLIKNHLSLTQGVVKAVLRGTVTGAIIGGASAQADVKNDTNKKGRHGHTRTAAGVPARSHYARTGNTTTDVSASPATPGDTTTKAPSKTSALANEIKTSDSISAKLRVCSTDTCNTLPDEYLSPHDTEGRKGLRKRSSPDDTSEQDTYWIIYQTG